VAVGVESLSHAAAASPSMATPKIQRVRTGAS
jgi:hypothetical protein